MRLMTRTPGCHFCGVYAPLDFFSIARRSRMVTLPRRARINPSRSSLCKARVTPERCTPSMKDINSCVRKALDRQWLDLTTPLGKGILAFLSAMAEDERLRILARANGGRAEAKKRGVKFGPKPKLAPHQEKEAVRMVHGEGKSLRAVAHHYHVGHSTVVRALERANLSKTASQNT